MQAPPCAAAVQARPPQISMRAAREEAELVLFHSVEAILQKNRLKPSQVGCPDNDACPACHAVASCKGGRADACA